ncbi:YaiI/YqxD family protein [Shewanella algae]|nr:YaiI/YqxD family protein [Shewanella algae]
MQILLQTKGARVQQNQNEQASDLAQIWVDADACPVVIREMLVRAAARTGINVTFVANQALRIIGAASVKTLQVPKGFDVADNEIVRLCQAGDLVISNDIPLAAEVIDKGAKALNSRGELLNRDNVRARLNMRDFLDTLRASGIDTGGSPKLSQADRQAFANELDKYLLHWQRTKTRLG